MEQFSRYDLHYLFEERNDKIKHYIRTLSDDDVFSDQDEIIINNMIEKYKFNPVKIEEEQLRNLILANLNSLFKGTANGECFRKHGKTDICIEYENRSAFVAECKIWSGIKNFLEL